MFGKDGFDDAEEKTGQIEATLGFVDLAQFMRLFRRSLSTAAKPQCEIWFQS